MLKAMRHHAKYFYVLFFIIILSFIFWGVGTVDQDGQTNNVAEIGKYKISGEEYWRAYDRSLRFYRDIYKEKFDEEMQTKMKLKERVLDTLVDNRVLLMAAEANGITVSNEELNEAIVNDPNFMRNGFFDTEVYRNTLRLSRLTPEMFESLKRQELIGKKMEHLIELSAHIELPEIAGIAADEQTMKAIRDSLTNDAKNKAVKAFIEGYKKQVKITVYKDRIS